MLCNQLRKRLPSFSHPLPIDDKKRLLINPWRGSTDTTTVTSQGKIKLDRGLNTTVIERARNILNWVWGIILDYDIMFKSMENSY